MRALTVGLLAITATVTASATERWPQFRGEGALGLAYGEKAPASWSITRNVAWVADVPGRGWSSPIVWGDSVYPPSAR